MKRLCTCISAVIVVWGMLLLGGSLAAQAAPSTTAVCGTISTSATWTPAGSPYQVCNTGATISAGVTVTVQSGVTVQFVNGPAPQLTVQGALLALGDPTQPITFTGVTASPGSWRGIRADAPVTPAVVILYYVTLDYGGTNAPGGAQVYADHAALTIKHSRLRNGQNRGVYATGNGPVTVLDTAVLNNAGEALRVIQPVNGLVLGGLTASGNLLNAVYIEGTSYLHGHSHWPAAGIPYIVNAVLGNFVGDTLTVDPGSELRFTASGWLNIAGDFEAIGTPDAPITLTGQVKSPGAWIGLVVYGGTSAANAQLENVTLEYGGSGISSGANADVTNGFLIARHSIFRHSAKDGVRINSAGHATLLSSQIVSNTLYGVRNTNIAPAPLRAVEASNNWWGDPAGPTADIAACSLGHGDRVSDGVLFRPVLTSTTSSAVLPLTDAPIMTLTPRRWFAPADGTTKVYFDIHVTDGDGAPLLGRKVRLIPTLGAVTDGGVTDANGNTLAFMVSFGVGDADVTATLDTPICEGALSPTARVTFQTPLNLTDLFPNSPASYFTGNIAVSPEPVLVGISTTLQVTLTNPLTAPLTVDVSLGYAQAGLGLTFGPIHDWVGQVIPAKSSLTLTTVWVPPILGNYCLQATYSITGAGAELALPAAGSSNRVQHNLHAIQGPTGSSNKPTILDKTKEALDLMGGFIGNAFDTDPFDLPLRMVGASIAMQLETASIIDNALGLDPPRQDFHQLTSPHKLQLPPLQPGGNLTPARAAAINALDNDLAEANAAGRASVIALDRSGGASAAHDLQWASIQSAAVIEYNRQMGTALISASVDLDNLLNISAGEGITSVIITKADVISVQQHLAVGWSAQEISDGHAVGLTDAELETIRKKIAYFDEDGPVELTGDLVPQLQSLRGQLYMLGSVLINPYAFQPHFSVSGSAGLLAPSTAAGNTLVQLSSFTSTVQVGNPLTSTKIIDLRIRRISLPADWGASVSPAQVTLAPGAVTTVTVTIVAGAPLLQGSQPSVAVEGYVGSTLLGGVVVQALAPNYVFFDGHLHLWLPLVKR